MISLIDQPIRWAYFSSNHHKYPTDFVWFLVCWTLGEAEHRLNLDLEYENWGKNKKNYDIQFHENVWTLFFSFQTQITLNIGCFVYQKTKFIFYKSSKSPEKIHNNPDKIHTEKNRKCQPYCLAVVRIMKSVTSPTLVCKCEATGFAWWI